MGAAKRIEAVECRLRADFPTALLLLGEAADLLRHAAPAEMAPKAPLQQGSSGALGNSKSQRGGSFSDFSGAFGMCDSGGGDLDVSSIHALASGVRGDSALAAALGFYAAGDLLKAHARLIDPDGAVALYTRASEVCAIHEASALVAKVEAEMIFRGFAPALAENDFDSALDILTRSRTKYHFFLKHATPRIAAIKSSKELFQQVQPLPFVAAAARRLGDKSKADATTALYKAKDTLQAQKCLDAATRCFQWASRGRADTQASLDGLRAEIAVHVFKDRAEACLSSAFSAVAAVDVTGSAEAHETALSELLEAFELFSCAACSKESADVRKLQHAIQADQTLRNAVEAMTNPTHARAPNAPKAFSPEDLPESDAQPESDALMHSTAPASKAPAPAPDEPLVQKTRAPFSDMLAALAKSRSSLKAVCGLRATTLRRWIARGAERLDQVTKIEGFLVSAAKFDPTTYTVAPVKNRRAPKATVELTAQLAHMSNLQDSLGEIQALKGTLVVPLALLQAELHRLQIILDPFAADRAVKAT
ncbi:hypothetical protein M885DRAFT_515314 [Pelagophyceae sp. CCMP2097]|nr:hypothetical protein M885DRAFT_515314 [Pelagophyceae sp. CCMP2097]|mmetsp:Transcript_26377/g.88673  ORF Transcript_26377/g.88673 Transcript_26377/m.88673 type:complete len:536 (+) Transcript_26377:3272-4879(+)